MLKTEVCNCTYARSRTVRNLATAVMAVATMLAFQAESFAQPANDLCVNATVANDGANAYDLTGATLDATAPAPLDANMQNDAWFSYTASCTGALTVETCEGVLGADTVLEIHAGSACPPAAAFASADDTAGCGASGFSSSITIFVAAGDDLLIRVSGWNGGEPVGTMDITCVAGALPACCVGDGTCAELSTADCFANPDGVQFLDGTVCADLTDECEIQACCAADGTCTDTTGVLCILLGNTPLGTGTSCATDSCTAGACCDSMAMCTDVADEAECMMLGGSFQGNGTSCATTTCPTIAPNDDCAGAIALSIPGLAAGSTVGQGGETLGTCGTTDGTGGGVWYSVIGDGTTLTATTCNPGTNYDTKLRVYTDGCATLTCVGGNDDGSPTGMSPDPACVIPETGSTANRASTVSWCAVSGVEYLILVYGFSDSEGDFELTISSDGIACVQACCFDDGTCQDLGSGECGTAGGTPQGPGTDCASVSCPQPEACCLPNGTCQEIFAADCTGLGGTPQGAGRLCGDVVCSAQACNCNATVNTFPFVEDFEDDEPDCIQNGSGTSGCNRVCAINGLWVNRANGLFDDTDFLTDEGGTTSGSTGPSVDATTGTSTGNYAYIETSSCTLGVAQVISPCLDLTTPSAPTFSFAYHMFGASLDAGTPVDSPAGALTVEVTTDLCQSFTTLFTISGNQGDQWFTQNIDLSAYRGLSNVRLLITATGGGDFTSDIAIDDLVVFDDAATGACCDAVGCTDGLSLTNCQAAGGIYQGDGSTCASVDCFGACCAGDGTCTDVTEVACSASGGTFQGSGTDCLTSSCAGACCQADGTCAEIGPDDCATAGGDYQGNGTNCMPNLCPQPPANDDCVDPLPEVFDGANPVDLTQATSSDLIACGDFPFDNGNPNGLNTVENDLFFQYTATCTGQLFVDTCGTAFDTRLAIYDDTCPNIIMGSGAVPLECNDDYGNVDEGDTGNACPAPGTFQASLSINATAGTTYVIRVGTFSTAPQTFMFDLNVECIGGADCDTCEGDVNGDTLIDGLDIQSFIDCYVADFGNPPSAACGCADAVDDQLIDALDLDAFVVALLNKPNVCDPGACCFFDGATMCTVTSQQICDSLGGNFTAGGDCSGDPCPVGRCCSNDGATCDDVSEVECASIGGDWDGGLSCATDPCPILPPNDDCAGAIEVFCGDLLIGETTVDATDDYNPTSAGCTGFQAIGGDIVYVFNSAVDQQVDVSMLNISYDASLYVVTDCDDLSTCVAGSDSFGLPSEDVSFMATAGTTYFIIADGFTIEGTYDLSVTCVVAGGPEACCFADGSCLDQTPGDCAMNGGTSQGIGTTCATTSCPQPPPANDDCDNAIVVTTGPNAGQANNSSAGADLVEASCQANSNGDVWFVWTADCDGNATIDTEGSLLSTSNDTVLSIYAVSCGAAELDCDDDGGSGLLSTVTFPVLTGEVYYIRVAGFSGNTGDININIACATTTMEACCFPDGSCTDELVGDCAGLGGVGQGGGTDCGSVSCPQPPPANDDCTGATAVTEGMYPYTTVDSTLDPAGPTPTDANMDNDVWFVYTASCTGSANINTCEGTAGPDTTLEVYDGGTCPPTVSLADSDDETGCGASGFSSSVDIPVVSGNQYLIRIGGWNAGEVSGTLEISCTAAGGPEACCFPDGSCSDQTPGDCSMMGGTSQGIGTICATTSCPLPPPANDDCANATDVTSTPLTDVVSIADATDDANIDPSCDSSFSCGAGPANNGIWYTYSAAVAGDLSVTVSGPDTVITFWSGADCNSLTELSCSDPQSDSISLLMGETVYIAISNWSCSSEPSGDATVDIDFTAAGGPEACCFPDGSCSDETPGDCSMMGGTNQGIGTDCAGTSCPQPPPANDDCANAEAISIGGVAMGNTDAATTDGLGFCGTSAGTNGAVWYSVIGDGTTLTAELCGSPYDSKIQIYEDGCATLTCVTGEDDDATCGGADPSVDWCAAMGVEYLIAVQGFSTNTGDYTLAVTSDATPCP